MMFNGAAEYFFFEGISQGVNSTIEMLPAMLTDKFQMENPTTKDCLEAFEWGFYFGLELTQEEFVTLTEEPITDTVTEGIVTVTINGKAKIQKNYNGNC